MITNKSYGTISATEIRAFLEFWPFFQGEAEEMKAGIVKDKDIIFTDKTPPVSWCHLYELPLAEYVKLSSQVIEDGSELSSIHSKLVTAPNQIAIIPEVCGDVDSHFASLEPLTKEEAMDLAPILAPMLAFSLSMYNSLLCLLYYSRFLNDLIMQVRLGDDIALFNAIRIDPTCIGCKPIIQRISKATMIQDTDFMKKLRNSLGNKPEKLAQANFQKMRLVFEILHESGAENLTDERLEELFVKELNLYDSHSAGGGSQDALRKFAKTYMRPKAIT
ncbi:MAG: hypothetical protein ACAH12_00225 [Methylophilaceae bacterium]